MKPGHVEVSTLDQASSNAIGALVKALEVYERRLQRYWADRDHEPREGSPAAAARGAGELACKPTAMFTQLDLLARDHLRTIQIVLGSGVLPIWSIHSLARVTVEVSARSWWILAPEAPDDRTARAILTELEMLRARQLLEAGTGNAQDRIDALVSAADRTGLTVALSDKGRPTRVHGQGFTNNTDVVLEMLPNSRSDTGLAFGEFLYRLLSGATHGNDWMVLSRAQRHGSINSDGYGLARLASDPARAAQVVFATVLAHATAVDRWCDIYGWPRFTTHPFYRNGVAKRLRQAVDFLSDWEGPGE